MNRALILGIAVFLAIVGIAMMTVDNTAEAGRKCCKCKCKCKCKCDCGCDDCCGHHVSHCCGCHGDAAPAKASAEAAPPAPAANSNHMRQPFGFRTVSFQR